MTTLDGIVAAITGAASGIGRATVERFLADGASVVAADVAPPTLEASARVATVQADVTLPSSAERIVGTTVERFGRLDVLCNIAGIMDRFLPVGEMTDDVWDRVIAVNLTGPMMLMRAAIPRMLDGGGGAIVNIASVAGITGGRAGAAYTASKHGLIGLTRNTAAMYGHQGIRCAAICPGGVATGIGLGGAPSALGMETLSRASPGTRVAQASEIASVCAFLASPDASFVNGAVLVADGGWTSL